MSTKYVITFSNQTEHGIETPEKLSNQTVIGYVTSIISKAARKNGFDLDNCTAYPVQGMYKGVAENSFRLEYIADIPVPAMKGFAFWIKHEYNQESVLLETYSNGEYKAELLFSFDKTVEL